MTVHVRPATLADAGALDAIYDHYILSTPITFDLEPWPEGKRAAWLADEIDGGERVLCAEDDCRALGFAWSGEFRPKVAHGRSRR